ncbi:Forkhead box protein J3 [Vanrija pseudolonga]|uniref:Forkhead box protein J3 n=1 Tax=Vanrija pseudolonga TaxID=143232 RepID=A0AAF0YLP5_9TREE|nr:Forkhead box protein J3 [Vanrija pseudolonga]
MNRSSRTYATPLRWQPASSGADDPSTTTRAVEREDSPLEIIPTVFKRPLTLPAPNDAAVRALSFSQSAKPGVGDISLDREELVRLREGHFHTPRLGRGSEGRNWAKMTLSEAAWIRVEEVGAVTKSRSWTARVGYDDSGESVKPELPYVILTKLVIASSPRKMLTLNQIYQAMEERWPYFRHLGQTFRNSIRHNLSMNPAFVNVERPSAEGGLGTGKGGYWKVSDDPSPPKPTKRAKASDGAEAAAPSVTRSGTLIRREVVAKVPQQRAGRAPTRAVPVPVPYASSNGSASSESSVASSAAAAPRPRRHHHNHQQTLAPLRIPRLADDRRSVPGVRPATHLMMHLPAAPAAQWTRESVSVPHDSLPHFPLPLPLAEPSPRRATHLDPAEPAPKRRRFAAEPGEHTHNDPLYLLASVSDAAPTSLLPTPPLEAGGVGARVPTPTEAAAPTRAAPAPRHTLASLLNPAEPPTPLTSSPASSLTGA